MNIEYHECVNKIRVDGPGLEFACIPFYRGPANYIRKYFQIGMALEEAVEGCSLAVLRIPDQIAFRLHRFISHRKIPFAVEVVAHSWDLFASGTTKSLFRPFFRVLWDIMQKKLCRSANAVSYVTEHYIQKRYPSHIDPSKKDRFETHYTSADLDDKYFCLPQKPLFVEGRSVSLCHIANINNYSKGHLELLKALKIIKERGVRMKTVIVGSGVLLEYFMRLCITYGLQSEVEFSGNISSSDRIIQVLRSSDIFVFPSRSEGLPRVLLEAMASGLPCISCRVGGIPEILSAQSLVDPGNATTLAAKILEFINDPRLMEEESNRNFVVANTYRSECMQKRREAMYLFLKRQCMMK